MRLIGEFEYRGVKVEYYEHSRPVRFMNGTTTVTDRYAFADGQDISRQVLTLGGREEWDTIAKALIDTALGPE